MAYKMVIISFVLLGAGVLAEELPATVAKVAVGYDVSDEVRDPFVPVKRAQGVVLSTAKQGQMLENNVKAVAEQIRLQTVISRGGKHLAVINGSLVEAGQKLSVQVQGRRIELKLAMLQPDPPRATLSCGSQKLVMSPRGLVTEKKEK